MHWSLARTVCLLFQECCSIFFSSAFPASMNSAVPTSSRHGKASDRREREATCQPDSEGVAGLIVLLPCDVLEPSRRKQLGGRTIR